MAAPLPSSAFSSDVLTGILRDTAPTVVQTSAVVLLGSCSAREAARCALLRLQYGSAQRSSLERPPAVLGPHMPIGVHSWRCSAGSPTAKRIETLTVLGEGGGDAITNHVAKGSRNAPRSSASAVLLVDCRRGASSMLLAAQQLDRDLHRWRCAVQSAGCAADGKCRAAALLLCSESPSSDSSPACEFGRAVMAALCQQFSNERADVIAVKPPSGWASISGSGGDAWGGSSLTSTRGQPPSTPSRGGVVGGSGAAEPMLSPFSRRRLLHRNQGGKPDPHAASAAAARAFTVSLAALSRDPSGFSVGLLEWLTTCGADSHDSTTAAASVPSALQSFLCTSRVAFSAFPSDAVSAVEALRTSHQTPFQRTAAASLLGSLAASATSAIAAAGASAELPHALPAASNEMTGARAAGNSCCCSCAESLGSVAPDGNSAPVSPQTSRSESRLARPLRDDGDGDAMASSPSRACRDWVTHPHLLDTYVLTRPPVAAAVGVVCGSSASASVSGTSSMMTAATSAVVDDGLVDTAAGVENEGGGWGGDANTLHAQLSAATSHPGGIPTLHTFLCTMAQLQQQQQQGGTGQAQGATGTARAASVPRHSSAAAAASAAVASGAAATASSKSAVTVATTAARPTLGAGAGAGLPRPLSSAAATAAATGVAPSASASASAALPRVPVAPSTAVGTTPTVKSQARDATTTAATAVPAAAAADTAAATPVRPSSAASAQPLPSSTTRRHSLSSSDVASSLLLPGGFTSMGKFTVPLSATKKAVVTPPVRSVDVGDGIDDAPTPSPRSSTNTAAAAAAATTSATSLSATSTGIALSAGIALRSSPSLRPAAAAGTALGASSASPSSSSSSSSSTPPQAQFVVGRSSTIIRRQSVSALPLQTASSSSAGTPIPLARAAAVAAAVTLVGGTTAAPIATVIAVAPVSTVVDLTVATSAATAAAAGSAAPLTAAASVPITSSTSAPNGGVILNQPAKPKATAFFARLIAAPTSAVAATAAAPAQPPAAAQPLANPKA